MTAPLIACDVSKYQVPVDDSYPHRWLIFRCCDGGYRDPLCDRNANWAAAAVKAGRMDGWTAYVVYRPGQNAAVLANAASLPSGGHLMVDVESWGGAIKGDHSVEINDLVRRLSLWYPGRVWGYGNRGDLASIYPGRGSLPVVVASYGGTKPAVPRMVGWQYTNGTYTVPGLPSSSPPFGRCDHNVLDLAAAESADSGGTVQIGDDMPLTEAEWSRMQDMINNALLSQRAWITAGYGGVPAALSAFKPEIVGLRKNIRDTALALGGQLTALPDSTPITSVGAALLSSNAHTDAALKAQAAGSSGGVDLGPILDELQKLPADVVAAIAQKLGSTA